jgi:hypothetical protein
MLPAIIAPLLQNGLGLVANAVMAKGKQYVEQKLGVELKPDMSPEDVANLQVAQMEHEEELLRLKLEENKLDLAKYEASLKDTSDARNREIQIATSEKAPLINKIITPILALLVVLLTFGLFGVVMFQETPVESSRKDILIYVLGVLSALSAQVASYYFGSSASSQAKNKMLEEAMK